MTRKIIIRPSLSDKRQPLLPSSPLDRRQSPFHSSSFDQRRTPLLAEQQSWSSRGGGGGGRRFTEVAGGTTAECAAIACCAPCGIANLLVLTMYKVPVGLCRKALRHQRRRRLLKRQSSEQCVCRCGCDGADFEIESIGDPMMMVESMGMDEDMMELEKEMWNKFYGTGFWRSPSQRTVD